MSPKIAFAQIKLAKCYDTFKKSFRIFCLFYFLNTSSILLATIVQCKFSFTYFIIILIILACKRKILLYDSFKWSRCLDFSLDYLISFDVFFFAINDSFRSFVCVFEISLNLKNCLQFVFVRFGLFFQRFVVIFQNNAWKCSVNDLWSVELCVCMLFYLKWNNEIYP